MQGYMDIFFYKKWFTRLHEYSVQIQFPVSCLKNIFLERKYSFMERRKYF